jgi:hypothetical protein
MMARYARRTLRMMIVEVLRALARGDDLDQRIVKNLGEFLERARSMKTPLPSIIADVISEMNKELTREGPRDDVEAEIEDTSARPSQ